MQTSSLVSDTAKWVVAETPHQDHDMDDCGLFTSGFAYAYARSRMQNLQYSKNTNVEKVVVNHSLMPEQIGTGLRSHVYHSILEGSLEMNNAVANAMCVTFQ